MKTTVLIIGATSAIAESVARLYAEDGARMFLVARGQAKLEAIAADLRVRGADIVGTFVMDANDYERLRTMRERAWEALGEVHVAIVAYGSLPDSVRAESDTEYLTQEFRTNAESVIACLADLATRFRDQNRGVIAVIGSVAGDRGRASNYLYGAAKAAVHAFSSGLRGLMHRHGVHVVTIKPGFVSTPMTANMNLPAVLTAEPGVVARRIKKAIEKRYDIVYVPSFWWMIMTLIKLLPEAVFKRLRF